MGPLDIVEKLFFSIFGQKDTADIALQQQNQPDWTLYFFKVKLFLYNLPD